MSESLGELIPVSQTTLSGELVQTVNLRDVHSFLEVASRFNDWFSNRVKQYGFIENQDFTTVTTNLVSGGQQIDVFSTLDMAKELSMVERNARGKEARAYFLECERRARQARQPALPDFTNPAEAARAWAHQYDGRVAAERQVALDKPKTLVYDQVFREVVLLNLSQLFSLLRGRTGQNFTFKTFLAFLRRHGIAIKCNPYSTVKPNELRPCNAYLDTWFICQYSPAGIPEWKVHPAALAGIIRLIDQDRGNLALGRP
jgi:anti-repressor protein